MGRSSGSVLLLWLAALSGVLGGFLCFFYDFGPGCGGFGLMLLGLLALLASPVLGIAGLIAGARRTPL
jgi:hypothetical protein